MPQPTTTQLRVLKYVKQQVEFWMKTNDINSPTHWTDIKEFGHELPLQPLELEALQLYLSEILEIIQNTEAEVSQN